MSDELSIGAIAPLTGVDGLGSDLAAQRDARNESATSVLASSLPGLPLRPGSKTGRIAAPSIRPRGNLLSGGPRAHARAPANAEAEEQENHDRPEIDMGTADLDAAEDTARRALDGPGAAAVAATAACHARVLTAVTTSAAIDVEVRDDAGHARNRRREDMASPAASQ